MHFATVRNHGWWKDEHPTASAGEVAHWSSEDLSQYPVMVRFHPSGFNIPSPGLTEQLVVYAFDTDMVAGAANTRPRMPYTRSRGSVKFSCDEAIKVIEPFSRTVQPVRLSLCGTQCSHSEGRQVPCRAVGASLETSARDWKYGKCPDAQAAAGRVS